MFKKNRTRKDRPDLATALDAWNQIDQKFKNIEIILQAESGEYFVAGIFKKQSVYLLETVVLKPNLKSGGDYTAIETTTESATLKHRLQDINYRAKTRGTVNIWFEETSIKMVVQGRTEISLGALESEILLKWYSHHSKTPRNDQCPCNSGEKFKKCCGGASDYPIIAVKFLPDQLNWIKEHGEYAGHMFAAAMEPSFLEDPDFLHDLARKETRSGSQEHASEMFTSALKVSPHDPTLRINYANFLLFQREYAEAILMIDELPANHPNRSLTLGLALSGRGDERESIPHFENAISINPKEELAYRILLTILEAHNHPSWDYWIEKSVSNFSSSPSVAYFYARNMLANNKFAELAHSTWLDELNEMPDEDVLEFRRGGSAPMPLDSKSIATRALLLRDMAMQHLDPDPARLRKIVDEIVGLDQTEDVCFECYFIANDFCANQGFPEFIAILYRRGHQRCIERGDPLHVNSGDPLWGQLTNRHPLEITLTACAWGVIADRSNLNKDWEQTVKVSEEAIRQDPSILDGNSSTSQALISHYGVALQRTGHNFKGLSVVQSLYEKRPEAIGINKLMAQLNKNYGRLGAAKHFYERQNNIETDIGCLLHISLISLIEENYVEADRHFSKYLHQLAAPEYGFQADVKVLGRLRKIYSDITAYSKSGVSKLTRAREINRQINSLLMLGEGPSYAISPALLSREDIARNLRGGILEQYQFEALLDISGDVSHAHENLLTTLPNIGRFPEKARLSLYEAEKLVLANVPAVDYSHTIFLFSKALEISLLEIVFRAFNTLCDKSWKLNEQAVDCFNKCKHDPKSQAKSLCSYLLEGQHLELGKMAHILRLCNGRTANKNALVGSLRRFILEDLNCPQILDSGVLEKIVQTGEKRNPIIHSNTASESEATLCRANSMTVLSELDTVLARGMS
jgi:tetratricopeptide (TPR) repeat protein